MVFVVLEGDELSVYERILDVFVSEQFHDVKDIFGFCVFGCGFPVSEGVEFDLEESWVLQLDCSSSALSSAKTQDSPQQKQS